MCCNNTNNYARNFLICTLFLNITLFSPLLQSVQLLTTVLQHSLWFCFLEGRNKESFSNLT